MERKAMTLSEYVDAKRDLEVQIAHAVEQVVQPFETRTGTRVTVVRVERAAGYLFSSTVEVQL